MKPATIAALLCAAMLFLSTANAQEKISHGLFDNVTLYRPQGTAQQFVLFLSGDDGWSDHTANVAKTLVARGAMVAAIDTPRLFAKLEAGDDECVLPVGDLENLSHYLQGYARLDTYHTPLLIGYSSGATLAYAMLALAPRGTFSGALTLGFCTDFELEKPFCEGAGTHFERRRHHEGMDLLPARTSLDWIALQGAADDVCDSSSAQKFVAQVPGARFVPLPGVGHRYEDKGSWRPQFISAYERLTAAHTASLPPPPTSLTGLPLIEVPATGTPTDAFAVLLSGDGGWAGLDKQVATALAAKGIPVIGLDSLRYFWSKRTPEGLAGDLDRVLRYYAAHWKRKRALLIGYSQGADVLPAAINRLPAASRPLVAQTVLLAPGENASWEFHLGNWLGGDSEAVPIRPEAIKLRAATTLCLYGADDDESLCPTLPAGSVTARELPGGHHFDGAYDTLAELILARLSLP